jgi:hypothetical protein
MKDELKYEIAYSAIMMAIHSLFPKMGDVSYKEKIDSIISILENFKLVEKKE